MPTDKRPNIGIAAIFAADDTLDAFRFAVASGTSNTTPPCTRRRKHNSRMLRSLPFANPCGSHSSGARAPDTLLLGCR
ncbi:MAG: hypothetical protein ACJ8C4_06655 [Gemmataceae bacterium]